MVIEEIIQNAKTLDLLNALHECNLDYSFPQVMISLWHLFFINMYFGFLNNFAYLSEKFLLCNHDVYMFVASKNF